MHRNLHFAILNELMESESIPQFDLNTFLISNRGVPFDSDSDYDFRPLIDVANHLATLVIDDHILASMETLSIYPGTILQQQIFPSWDGEDDYFDVPTLSGIEKCCNLTSLSHQLLPPGQKSDIAAISLLHKLTEIGFTGGTFDSLEPLLACESLKMVRFTTSTIPDNYQNRDTISKLLSRNCEITFRTCRGLVL